MLVNSFGQKHIKENTFECKLSYMACASTMPCVSVRLKIWNWWGQKTKKQALFICVYMDIDNNKIYRKPLCLEERFYSKMTLLLISLNLCCQLGTDG